jgi:SAM-dependent methyltransferase
VVGVDRDEQAIELARRGPVTPVPMSFLCGELEDLPSLGLGSFDLVFCALVLHLSGDPAGLVARLWEAVAPGGTLVVRALDDGLAVCTPESADSRIVDVLTPLVFDEADRFGGRELPGLMARLPEATGLSVDFPTITTWCRPGVDGRLAYFDVVHGWKREAVMGSAWRVGGDTLVDALERERERFASDETLFAATQQVLVAATKAPLA